MNRIWSILEQARERHGTRTAAVVGGLEPTWEQLGQRIEALALALAEAGVAKGERVSLLDVNSLGSLAAYYAAAGLGAILQPINHRLAPGEIALVAQDAGARVLVASQRFAELVDRIRHAHDALGGSYERVLWLDDVPCTPGRSFAPAALEGSDVAHLYYTSGTTGKPRGVMLTHSNVCAHADAVIRELELCAEDRWGHIAPMFHLADAWAIFAITQVGGCHLFLDHFSAEAALASIERGRITLTNLVPTMLNAMVKHPRARAFDYGSLRMILSGGAPIAPALVKSIIATFRCEYAQTYGMTETSPYLTLSLLAPDMRSWSDAEQLAYRARTGRPMHGVELEVVDEQDRSVPRDDRTVGEIRVRGATVTPGYWNQPAETAAALRGGWLYTGDLATIERRGSVNIVDRKKDLIITGGEKVYSTEVEAVLYEHPSVLEAAVFGVPDATWGESVRAAVVLKDGARASAEDLIEHCRAKIARFKAPCTIGFLTELPKTGSGKISKKMLRDAAGPDS